MSSMIKCPAGHPARLWFGSLCLAFALGLVAHVLAHTLVNPHYLTVLTGAYRYSTATGPFEANAPSVGERWSAVSNPDSLSVLPALLTTAAPAGLVVFIAAPILVHLCLHWPPPLHPPQFTAAR